MFERNKIEERPRPNRRFTDPSGEPDTVIGQGIRVQGELKGKANVDVQGVVDGQARLEGLLRIRAGGRFLGDVIATAVVVEGEVRGTITAEGKVELRSSCKVIGDIRAQSIAIADGCFFEGNIHMEGGRVGGDAGNATSFQEKRQSS